jgi:ComF family protein
MRPSAAPSLCCTACSRASGPLSACVAAFWFEGDVERWVRRFKYPRGGLAGLDAPAHGVARWLAAEAAALAPGEVPQRIVPVPLHPHVLRRRGFNPAAVLARAGARVRGPGALMRTRDTPSQTGLDRLGRRRNVRGAFRARSTQPERVWLVDDVVTTGATLAEAARALRGAGAREIVAICSARTPPPGGGDAWLGPTLEPGGRTVDQ